MEIQCPSCNEDLIIDDESLGIVFECPSCSQKIEIGDEPSEELLSSRDEIQEEVGNDSIQTDVAKLGSTSIESTPETIEKKNDTPVKNPYIIPAVIIATAILVSVWILKQPSQLEKRILDIPQQNISIHDAAFNGNIDAVKKAIAGGENVNSKNDLTMRTTPLHSAALGGYKEIVELLIAEGADVNAKANNNITPIMLAAGSNHGETVKLLIANGSDIDTNDVNGMTALHAAAGLGHWEATQILVRKGAYLNPLNEKGLTPLDLAVLTNHPGIADLLRSNGGISGKN